MTDKSVGDGGLTERQKIYREGYRACIADLQEFIRLHGDSIPVPPAQSPMDMSINDLELTSRAHNRLWNEGLRTVSDIYKYHEDNYQGLLEIKNLGKLLLKEINDKLVELGYPELRKIRYT